MFQILLFLTTLHLFKLKANFILHTMRSVVV